MFSEEQSGGNSQKKRNYTHFTLQHRAKIDSLECGNTAAVRHFSKDFPFYCLFHELISNIIIALFFFS